MNYLAHAHLSFGSPDILVGNMISDFVKGRKKFNYPLNIQDGITLHRAIDSFTDVHPVTREAKIIFKKDYGLYSAPFMDIVYDHFLALDINRFTEVSLNNFSANVYDVLDQYANIFPQTFSFVYPFMKKHNWLFNYRYLPSIEKSFYGLVRRAKYMSESNTAFRLLLDNYDVLNRHYNDFFPELEKFARIKLDNLLSAIHKSR